LTFEAMGTRWGYLSSGQAQQVSSSGTVDITVPATLLGLAETIEGPVPGAAARAGVYGLSPIPPLVSTTFVPGQTGCCSPHPGRHVYRCRRRRVGAGSEFRAVGLALNAAPCRGS